MNDNIYAVKANDIEFLRGMKKARTPFRTEPMTIPIKMDCLCENML